MSEAAASGKADIEKALKPGRLEYGELFQPGLGRRSARQVVTELSPDIRPICLMDRPPSFFLCDKIEHELDKQVDRRRHLGACKGVWWSVVGSEQ